MRKLAALLAGVAIVQQAWSQETEGGLSEVVVTAQRRAENLQDVPIAITAVSAEQLRSAGIITTQALPALVSGLNVGNVAGAFQPRVRGVGTSFFGPGVENPVALYIDDVYYASQFASLSDLYEVEQIAVLKGPQGTLFGRNATGGVIQMTTRQPEKEFASEFATDLDQYLTSRNYAYVTGGLSDGVRANLFARYTTQDRGWGRNVLDGSDVRKIDGDWLVRGKLDLDAGDTTHIRLSGDYSKRRDNLGPNYRLAQNPPAGFTALLPGLGAPTSVGGPIQSSNSLWDVSLDQPNHNRYEGRGVSLAVEQDLGFASLTSITAYRDLSYSFTMDADGSTAKLYNVFQDFDSDQFSQELRMASKADGPIQWLVGGYYFKAKDAAVTQLPFYDASGDGIGVNAPLADFLFIGQAFGFADTEERGVYDFKMNTESFAAFGEVTAKVLEHTKVTAGLRYTHDDRKFNGFYQQLIDGQAQFPDTAPPPFTSAPIPPDVASNLQLKEGNFTWRFALTQEFSDTAMGYASYNRGYKSGGYNMVGGAIQTPYKSEHVDAFEVGMKLEFPDQRLRVNPALFYSDYKNIQVNTVALTTTIAANAPAAKLYGFDLDTEWRATNALSFNFGLEWMRSEFKSFPDLPSFLPLPDGGVVPITISGAGKRFAQAPDFTSNLGVTYRTQLSGGQLVFNVLESYNGGSFFEADNVVRQDSYNLVSTAIDWTSPNERFTIGVYGRNLTDEAVAATASGAYPIGFISDYSNPPRTYGISLKYRFGTL